jgi:ketosteroid isomerase-like protein
MADGTDVVRRLVDAANARDWEALLAVCAPDVTLIHPLAAIPYRNAEGVREFFVTSADALPDQYLRLDAFLAEGDVAAFEGCITATEDGEQISTPCAFFFTLRDGLIHQIRMYYDTAIIADDYEDE